MRIYKLLYYDTHHGTLVSFHPSYAEAKKVKAETMKSYGKESYEEHEIVHIDFEPTKKGILRLLREHAPEFDNG